MALGVLSSFAMFVAALVALVLLVALLGSFILLPLRPLQRRFAVPPPQKCAVLVTGVSSGLGEAFAHDLAALGFLVFGTVRKQADAAALLSKGVVHPVLLDVGKADQFPAALSSVRATLAQEGRSLCALVNNAGITGFDKTGATPDVLAGPEHYERVMSTNVYGVLVTSSH